MGVVLVVDEKMDPIASQYHVLAVRVKVLRKGPLSLPQPSLSPLQGGQGSGDRMGRRGGTGVLKEGLGARQAGHGAGIVLQAALLPAASCSPQAAQHAGLQTGAQHGDPAVAGLTAAAVGGELAARQRGIGKKAKHHDVSGIVWPGGAEPGQKASSTGVVLEVLRRGRAQKGGLSAE